MLIDRFKRKVQRLLRDCSAPGVGQDGHGLQGRRRASFGDRGECAKDDPGDRGAGFEPKRDVSELQER